MKKFSLITITSGRKKHLFNMLRGIQKASILPTEVIIVAINLTLDLKEFTNLPIKIITIETSVEENVPLASARNLGAKSASTNNLLFLDVDCIPSHTYFEEMLNALQDKKGLIMGTPRYLTQEIKKINNKELKEKSVLHPDRNFSPTLYSEENYSLFWSLCFAIEKNNFDKIGGFDESFKGYGAEDTDFAWTCNRRNIPFSISPAVAFHQQHPVYKPPLQHFHSILQNAEVFFKKWGCWPMEEWLKEFENFGLIIWDIKFNKITLKKVPSQEMLKRAYKPKKAFV
ncbi:glycosyltransferase family 2 protein [Mesonia maritima]|uniref:Glycosyltransferase involved in capsule biosynthesis n=1 Tax=Mesonia maritima TaxID=1793873 RepID=A0ABU1K9G6_9FLAO|nr:galactosyltransferase-related protein [Mesonia maritima]MDR6302258.1 putative glycosyltransferase involved in capsule biosynthesis [Mesonia maritima]